MDTTTCLGGRRLASRASCAEMYEDGVVRLGDRLRRLDERSARLLGPLFIAANVIAGVTLSLVYRSWRPFGIVIAPFIGCAVATFFARRRGRE